MAAHQAPPSLGFSRQEHWSGLPFPSPMHESESEVTQSYPTRSDPMDSSLPGSSIHGIFQARVLEWVAKQGPFPMKLCSEWNSIISGISQWTQTTQPQGSLSGFMIPLCPPEPQRDTCGLLFTYTCVSASVVVQLLSHVQLQLHELQHARLPCPSPSPRVCSNSCPSSWWCDPTI